MNKTVPYSRPHLALALVVFIAGCAENGAVGAGDETAVPRPTAQKIKPEQSMPPENTGRITSAGTIELSAHMIAPAISDLAVRVGATEQEIRILRAIPVIWNDGAMGCPQPDRSYTQALVPGYWVVLEHNSRSYSYHANRKGNFRLCEKARVNPTGLPPHGRYNTEV